MKCVYKVLQNDKNRSVAYTQESEIPHVETYMKTHCHGNVHNNTKRTDYRISPRVIILEFHKIFFSCYVRKKWSLSAVNQRY